MYLFGFGSPSEILFKGFNKLKMLRSFSCKFTAASWNTWQMKGKKTCFKSLTCSRFLPESKGFCLGGWEAHWFRFKDVSRTMADQQIGVHTVVVTNWFFILLYFLGKGSVEFNFWVFVSCPLVPYRNDHFIQRHPKTFFFFILLGL